MSASTSFQNTIVEKLRQHFTEVEKEWRITKGATDPLSVNADVYAPRLDVAVGPFNVREEDKVEMVDTIKTVFSQKAPQELKNIITSRRLKQNQNPRCTIAIEVVYSGSSKHILGDITNASVMGLYGFVVASNSTFEKLKRIFEYSKVIKQVGKVPEDMFSNVCVISGDNFLRLL